jgi:hypothetical protein
LLLIHTLQFLTQVFNEVRGAIRHFSEPRLAEGNGDALEIRADLGDHSAQALDLVLHLARVRDFNQVGRLEFGSVEIVAEIVRKLANKFHHIRH